MGTYTVTCVTKQPCPRDEARTHINEVGVSGPEGHRVLAVHAARLMLSAGDTLTMGAATDADAELRKGKCSCGFKMVRTLAQAGAASDRLLTLSSCG
jgi:hypothetical protein